MAITAIRVADEGNSKWIIRAGNRHMHVVKRDDTFLGILSMPHTVRYKVFTLNYQDLMSSEATPRFESEGERSKLLNAMVDLLTIADDFRGEPAACTNGSFDTIVKWCEGDDIV